jgi:RNA polymerase sigma factor (TIGR02999 family)
LNGPQDFQGESASVDGGAKLYFLERTGVNELPVEGIGNSLHFISANCVLLKSILGNGSFGSNCESARLSSPDMPGDVTQLLTAIDSGDPKAAEELLPLVYEELRRLAAYKMANEKPGQTLQATALVHEAWLRVAGSDRQQWRGREHFFSAAAEAMRRILVDNARRKQRMRHGGGMERVVLDAIDLPVAQDDEKCLRVNEYLEKFAIEDPEKAEIVKLRVFAGLGVAEIAAIIGCADKTVQRHWNFAKAWLSREMRRDDETRADT